MTRPDPLLRPPFRHWLRGLAALCATVLAALPLQAMAQTLRIGMAADVTALDPHYANIAPNNAVAWHVFDALANVDADTRLIPGLATSWRALDDTNWEFVLRKGVRFHDGSPFDARDVEFSIRRAAALADKGGQFGGFVRAIREIQIVDPHTIRFKTAKPHAVLPQDLNSIFIVSRAVGDAGTEDFNAGRAAVGTGPFRLESFARGNRVDLVRNDTYWGDKPAWARVTLRILSQDAARMAALLAGDVDAIENIPTSDVARIARDQRLRIERKVSWRTIFLHLDQYRDAPPGATDANGKPLARNPFRDRRVRAALSAAIDRKALVDKVMEGLAVPAGNLVAPPVFAHDASLRPPPFDPKAARQLLAEAGYPEGFRLTLSTPNNRYINDEQVAQTVAQMWARIGVQVVRVEALPAATYFTKARNGDFGVALLGWGSFAGDLALRSLVATPSAEKGLGSWNWGGYSDAQLDRAVEQALGTVDQARREALAKAAMAIAVKDYAVILLHHQVATWAMRSDLRYPGRTDEYTLAQFFSARPK
ncbi:MAG: ABC transporter substrate-binding protein [Betaproteobacteria bacterium]|nr:ABC transporter substrate-binding protein [Betaproteobacteria bacterium]